MKKNFNVTAREFVANIANIKEDLPSRFHIDYFGSCTIDLHDLVAMCSDFEYLFDGSFVNCRFEPDVIHAELLSANFSFSGNKIPIQNFIKPLIGSFRFYDDLLVGDDVLEQIFFQISQNR